MSLTEYVDWYDLHSHVDKYDIDIYISPAWSNGLDHQQLFRKKPTQTSQWNMLYILTSFHAPRSPSPATPHPTISPCLIHKLQTPPYSMIRHVRLDPIIPSYSIQTTAIALAASNGTMGRAKTDILTQKSPEKHQYSKSHIELDSRPRLSRWLLI